MIQSGESERLECVEACRVNHVLCYTTACACYNSPTETSELLPYHWVMKTLSVCVCVCVCVSVAKKIDELQDILKKKDEDMRRMEERYKRYVEKARTVSTDCREIEMCSERTVSLNACVCVCVSGHKDSGPQAESPAWFLLKFRCWRTSWRRRTRRSSTWRSDTHTLFICVSVVVLISRSSLCVLSMIPRGRAPDTTRRRSSSSQPGTTWWGNHRNMSTLSRCCRKPFKTLNTFRRVSKHHIFVKWLAGFSSFYYVFYF